MSKISANPNAKLIARGFSMSGNITRMHTITLNGNFGPYPLVDIDFVEESNGAKVYYKVSKIGADARALQQHFGIGDTIRVDGDLYELPREWNGNKYIDNEFDEKSFVQMVSKRPSRVSF